MKTNKKILIVDDNTDFCDSFSDLLELEGYEAVRAHDGFEALEAVKEDGFDLVLMDVKMPGMDGVETFSKLKEISPETPVIMLTAYAVEDRIRTALREGAYGAFQKPVDFEKLFCCIERSFTNGALFMVVDDNQDLSANLLDILIEKGYRGVAAKDGEIAIQMARENKFDFILLDMNLPNMNGLETYQTICDIRPEVVVIIITGYKEEMKDLIEQAQKANAYACLEKPLNMDRLQELIQKALG